MNITKTAMITVCGRPNVGKSSLTNALVGEKIAIVSDKPQTTRNRIYGVVNRGDTQYVLLDTPGLHKPRSRLGDYMVKVVRESLSDVECALLLVEPIPNVGGPEAELIARIKTLGCPSVLVINKVDTLEHKEELLEVIQTYGQAHEFTAVVPVSARTGEGVEELLDVLDGFLPQGPQLFPEDMVTDQPERQMMAEILREKLLLCLIEGTWAAVALAEATARAVQRIPDAHCNGDMHAALDYAAGVKHKQKEFLAKQGVHAILDT